MFLWPKTFYDEDDIKLFCACNQYTRRENVSSFHDILIIIQGNKFLIDYKFCHYVNHDITRNQDWFTTNLGLII